MQTSTKALIIVIAILFVAMMSIGFDRATAQAGITTSTVILARGDEGRKVRFVQRVLDVHVTGRYNWKTFEEVKRFQKRHKLSVTGRVNRNTMRKIRHYWDNLRTRRQHIYNDVISVARNQKGDPYVYGADGPDAFDCSGLTKFAWERASKQSLYHHATTQFRESLRLPKRKARPGDLVFFHNSGDIYHAAVYAGKGYIIHASRPGTDVVRAKIWTPSVYFATPFKRFIPRPA